MKNNQPMGDKKEFPYPNEYQGKPGETHIQHKGTDLCMDWICPDCKYLNHIDGDFNYEVGCENCPSVFVLGEKLSLTKLDTKIYKRWSDD